MKSGHCKLQIAAVAHHGVIESDTEWMSRKVVQLWRQPLDCGGLTPLFLRMMERAQIHNTPHCGLHAESQSGVKPPQSKASRHSCAARREISGDRWTHFRSRSTRLE